jgi:hypothetical protein
MSESNELPPPAPAPGEKKPYEKPAIAWEEPLEVRPALMAGCIKLEGQQGACESGPGS